MGDRNVHESADRQLCGDVKVEENDDVICDVAKSVGAKIRARSSQYLNNRWDSVLEKVAYQFIC